MCAHVSDQMYSCDHDRDICMDICMPRYMVQVFWRSRTSPSTTEDLQEFYKTNLTEAMKAWAREEWLQTYNQADHGDGEVQRLPMTIFD